MILGVSLYVLGFAMGPTVWGPLSEYIGRKPSLFTGYIVFALMQIPTALSPSLAGVLVSRCIAGTFGASTVTLVGTSYADFWEPAQRGSASALYSAACYLGPTIGPIAGSYITESSLGWRWTAWITLILAAVVGIPSWFLVPETYAPVLRRRAAGEATKFDIGIFVRKFVVKPAQMLGSEVMVSYLPHQFHDDC